MHPAVEEGAGPGAVAPGSEITRFGQLAFAEQPVLGADVILYRQAQSKGLHPAVVAGQRSEHRGRFGVRAGGSRRVAVSSVETSVVSPVSR